MASGPTEPTSTALDVSEGSLPEPVSESPDTEMPPLERVEDSTNPVSFPYTWLLSNFARTLGDPGRIRQSYSHFQRTGPRGIGFQLVIASDNETEVPDHDSDNIELTDQGMLDVDSDNDEDMPGLEPNDHDFVDGQLQSLFQPVQVRLQLFPNASQGHLNLDATLLRDIIRSDSEPNSFFSDHINSLLLDLFTEMRQQETVLRPLSIDVDQIPLIRVERNMIDDNQNCAVCLENYAESSHYKRLVCNRAFHGPCVDRWLLEHGNCPICRAPYVGHPE